MDDNMMGNRLVALSCVVIIVAKPLEGVNKIIILQIM